MSKILPCGAGEVAPKGPEGAFPLCEQAPSISSADSSPAAQGSISGTDVFTTEKRSAVMARVKGRDTGPELKLRRLLHAAGYRFRLHGPGLPGRPDLVFRRRRAAVFVHGCFWHGHDCPRGARAPKTNAAYWSAKIGRNRARDAEVQARLQAQGWTAHTVWECELKAPAAVLARLQAALGPARSASGAAASAASSAA